MRTLIVFILVTLISSNDLVYGGIKEDIAKSIVRVRSGSKYSTGFFWKNGTDIVTTLHSISNKNDIEVYVNDAIKWRDANVIRAYKNSDLVLLRISNYNSDHFINRQFFSQPVVDTKVFTIGYNSGNVNYQDRDFMVGLLQGNNQLKDLLPSSAEQEIIRLGFPSLQAEITYLKGQLLHGFSGSPVLDFEGKLVGVANGGLENGAAGISWCITAKSLVRLEQSNEGFPHINQNSVNVLFASESYESDELIHLNEFTFQKTKTRTFAQLDQTGNYSTYQEMGLYQLLGMFQMNGIQYNDFVYDIYTEQKSGATIVIPGGMELKKINGLLFAISDDGTKRIFIDIKRTFDVQQASVLFEQNIMTSTGIFSWIQDPRLSFLQPLIRPDNVIINRKGFYNLQPNKYLFEVLAGKESIFLGLYILMDNAMNPMNLMFINPVESAKYSLAAQLTTFSY